VIEVSAQAFDTARRILALREEHRAAVTTHLARAAANGHRVLEHLYERPIVSVADIQTLLGTTYPAASNVVNRLATLGILREITGYRRNRLFRYESYIQLFSETQAEPVPPPPAPTSAFAFAAQPAPPPQPTPNQI
jgi:hypothetical protein